MSSSKETSAQWQSADVVPAAAVSSANSAVASGPDAGVAAAAAAVSGGVEAGAEPVGKKEHVAWKLFRGVIYLAGAAAVGGSAYVSYGNCDHSSYSRVIICALSFILTHEKLHILKSFRLQSHGISGRQEHRPVPASLRFFTCILIHMLVLQRTRWKMWKVTSHLSDRLPTSKHQKM